jgi:hypothetical protein
MRSLLVLLVACATPSPATTEPDAGSDDSKADGETCARVAPIASVGATTKLSQLTGDFDRERGTPTTSRTLSRFGLWGTDLGASFEHEGRTFFLFGDSIDDGTPHPMCGDSIASSVDLDPTDGLELDFVVDGNGKYVSPEVPDTRLACYEVPLDGISANGAMYVWFSTDTMSRSVLARSDDNGRTFARVHDLSSGHFVNVSVVREGNVLYLFGSGTYRASEVFLARVPIDAIEDRDAYRFYAGPNRPADEPSDGCSDSWVADEAAAVPLFGPACVGELSAHHDAALDAWVVLYNCDQPRGVQARIARGPTGPWSEQVTVFDPWTNGGYCHFMHASYEWGHCDEVQDPNRDNEWGGEYGPYLIERFSRSVGEHAASLVFVLSTWNPYNTMLMQTELRYE